MTSQFDTGKANVSIVIPVFNQLAYTQGCVESLNRAGIADGQIIIVNNASTDGTKEFLATRPEIRTIHNSKNLGCGPAWTQGAKASTFTWTVVMNNDVLVPPGCMEGLVAFAEKEGFDVVSPAWCGWEMDYDFAAHAVEFMERMKGVSRRGVVSGSFFMVHRRVFDAIGYFNDFGGFEDDDFFRRVLRAGFKMATTGGAFYHHFGMVTQKSIPSEQVMAKVYERRARYRRETGLTWHKRKMRQVKQRILSAWWRHTELWRFGHTLHEQRKDGRWIYL